MVKKTGKTQPKRSVVKNKQLDLMLKSFKKINLLPLAIFLVAVFALVALFLFLRKNLIVATINGQPLTRFEVIKFLEKSNGKQAVDSLLSKMLLLQEARKKRVEVTDQQIESEIKKIEKQLKSQGSSLASVLSAQGLTRNDLNEQIKLRLILNKVLADKLKVADKEVTQYIAQNRANYPETLGEAELKKTVRSQLENQKLSTAAQTLLQNLKTKAKIQYFINY